MKARGFRVVLLAATVATQFTAQAAESTNRGGLGAIFQQILKSTLTNLTQSQTGTNVISSTNTNAPAPSTYTNTTSLASIPQFELSAGLKEAIGNGLSRAVTTLGRTNGFFTNSIVRIPLPDQFGGVDKMLRAVGQGPLVDQF